MLVHGLGDLDETGNVGTSDERRELSLGNVVVLLGRVEAVPEAALHNAGELFVDGLGGPVDTLGVLGHLESGDGDTTTVSGLSGAVPETLGLALDTVSLVDVDGLDGGAHVGALSEVLGAGGDHVLGLLLVDLVLGGAGKDDVDLLDVRPGALALEVGEAGSQGGVFSGIELGEVSTVELDVGDELNVGLGEALIFVGDEGTLGVGEGDDLSAELNDLEGSVLGNVSGAGDGDELVGEGLLSASGVRDHVVDVVDESEAGGLGADERSSPASTLSGDDTLPLVAVGLVGTEHVTNLTSTNTDITSGDISELANVAGKLAHEGVAEATDLVVALALGVKVGTTLSSSHVHWLKSVPRISIRSSAGR